MKKINVYVWWSSGKGDGDGYDEEIEVTDEQYNVFKELKCNGKNLDLINDPRIIDICRKKNNELINTLYENSKEYEEESYRDECLIDPDDDEYDPDGEEEQFTESYKDWWFSTYDAGVKIKHLFN